MNKETTHSVPASWYQRLLGFFIDYAICLIIAIPISEDVFDSYFAVYEESNGFTYVSNRYMESEVAKGISCLIYIVYTLTFESIFNKTIGKVITCTVVRDRKSLEKVGFWRVFGRTLCRLIPLDGLSFVAKKPIGWHDSISGTIVVNSIYSYAAFYERIKQLNTGFIRLHWVLSIIAGIPTFGVGFIAYWIVVRVALWIIDGFKEDKEQKYA